MKRTKFPPTLTRTKFPIKPFQYGDTVKVRTITKHRRRTFRMLRFSKEYATLYFEGKTPRSCFEVIVPLRKVYKIKKR